MKIANIIYENDLVNHTMVDYINYINQPVEYDSIDKTKPTLYVGWEFMKSCNPNNDIIKNADILKKKIITNELYWEFSFNENKASHVRGVENFIKNAPDLYFTPKYTYTNLDPVFFSIKDFDDIIAIIPKDITKAYNYKNEMLYLLRDENIWGIDLKMYKFFGFDNDKILELIKSKSISICDDIDGEIYISYYRQLSTFVNLKRYVVVLY